MHDQLRDMGRRIVCEQSPKEPEKRSRLWSREEVIEVLEEHKGTRKVEGILLDYSMWSDILPYSKGWQKDRFRINDFAMMSKLRLLQVNGVGLKGNIEHLPSSLRWLCWQRCPMKSLSSNFYLKKLVVLDLSDSKFSQAWNNGFENKRFEYLKVLNLSRCFYLAESPNFSGFPRLERLILKQCWALVDLHESIGQLKTLVYLDLTECVKLVRIPRSICMLHSLEELFLTSSVLLDEFEGIMRVMDLQSHSSRPVGPKPISGPPIILKSMGRLKSLVRLDLVGTSIEEIPNAIGLLKNLERLRINYCRRLRSLPELPSSLIYLDAMGCKSLEEVPDLSNLKNLWTLCLKDCRRLAKILGLEGVESLNDLDVTGCVTLTNTMRKVLVQDVFNSQSFSFCESYRIGDEEINNKEMSLCLVFELEEEVQYALVNGILDIKACIHRDGKRINCLSDLQINGIQMNRREITYIYHFQGLNWFAFPLKSKDEIVIEEIEWNGISPPSKLKHFGLSLKDRERIQQPVIPHSFADMVKDVYNWLNDTFFRTTG